jgi:hypothetical protein
MDSRKQSEKLIQILLRRADAAEARSWLGNHRKNPHRNIGEMSHDDSKSLVERMYELGAKQVIVSEIGASPGGEYESTDNLVVKLPEDKAARASLFDLANEHTMRMGFEPGDDYGQEYLFVWFD